MLERALPQRIDLRRLRRDDAEMHGIVELAAMGRLGEALESTAGTVAAELTILFDQNGRAVVRGAASVTVTMQCQRCLGPVHVPLEARFELEVVESEAAAEELGRDDEPVVAPGGELNVVAMLEDELILCLPVVATHEGSDRCAENSRHFGPPGEEAPEAENPFAVLESLKSKNSD
ncbi:MAG: YceD family protein [Ectothiorhodospiraceae bacterium]|jgi:uncharacterized protein